MDWTSENEEERPSVERPSSGAQRPSGRRVANAVLALVVVLAVGGLGFAVGHFVVKSPVATPARSNVVRPYFPSGGYGNFSPTPPASSSSATAKESPANIKLAASVDKGLVDIDTGLSYEGATAAGTGMILSSNGLVLTNNHVIDGATSITARDVATNTTYQATVVGYDVTSDVALLQLTNASGLTTVRTGNSDTVVTEEKVLGIGNAGGAGGTPSIAAGSVVALDQSITATDDASPSDAEQLTGMIKVNAAIEPGDSGGPLVNAKGHVIGMDTAGSSNSGTSSFDPTATSATTAFAIPINTALAIVKSIENDSATSTIHIGTTAFLGIEIGPSYSSAPGFGSGTTTSGVEIEETVPNSPAANSALSAGDVIVSLNGQSVTTATSLQGILQQFKTGDVVHVGYVNQDGVSATLSLRLGSGPPQ